MIARKCDRCGSFYIPDDSMRMYTVNKKGRYMKRFIIFTNEDLDKIKSGQMVVCEGCDFSESKEDPYDIYCVSEEWMNQYDSTENLP